MIDAAVNDELGSSALFATQHLCFVSQEGWGTPSPSSDAQPEDRITQLLCVLYQGLESQVGGALLRLRLSFCVGLVGRGLPLTLPPQPRT